MGPGDEFALVCRRGRCGSNAVGRPAAAGLPTARTQEAWPGGCPTKVHVEEALRSLCDVVCRIENKNMREVQYKLVCYWSLIVFNNSNVVNRIIIPIAAVRSL